MSGAPVLTIEHLSVVSAGTPAAHPILSDVSLSVRPGEVLGLVGESGCGKTTTALSALGFWPAGLLPSGSVILGAEEIVGASPAQLRALRGRVVSYVPQNPTTALNPARRIGSVFCELLLAHGVVGSRQKAEHTALAALGDVGLPDPRLLARRYPHELSGGQQQRVTIAMAMACRPALVVLDEPTTGLDVSTQKQILRLLRDIRDSRSVAMIYVTHDLKVLCEIATRMAVMYAGRVVETGPLAQVFASPRHPYTQALLAAIPDIRRGAQPAALQGVLRRDELPPGCPFTPRCPHARLPCAADPQPLLPVSGGHSVACWRWHEVARQAVDASRMSPGREPRAKRRERPVLAVSGLGAGYSRAGALSLSSQASRVVSGFDLELHRGRIVALVGESGSGKSTIARTLAGLMPPLAGEIRLDGQPLADVAGRRSPEERRRIQFVFQNPDASLNPRRRVGRILTDALRSFRVPAVERRARAAAAIEDVQLPFSYLDRYPPELSGGERQRVALARALVVRPDVLLCDEILSALDVSVQAGILDLLRRIAEERGLAILFISHDLSVVRALADTILVLYRGRTVSAADAASAFAPPYHPYFFNLLDALPGAAFVEPIDGGPALPGEDAAGDLCVFLPRCPVAASGQCDRAAPPLRASGEKRILCHRSLAELTGALRPASGGGAPSVLRGTR